MEVLNSFINQVQIDIERSPFLSRLDAVAATAIAKEMGDTALQAATLFIRYVAIYPLSLTA